MHDPQWPGSLVRLAQTEVQAVRPLHDWQLPPLQMSPATHWAGDEQVLKQLVFPLQTYWPHMIVVESGQLPFPSQTAALVADPLLQVGCRQVVSAPGREQVDLVPLQVPWQFPAPAHAAWPAFGGPVMKPQVPGEPPLQNSHDPLHAVLQHTPSTQLLLTHCDPAEQVWPVFFLQVPVTSQLLVPVQLSGSSALVIATQVPPAPVQAWHAAQDVDPQQNPSMQAALVHSTAVPQAMPFPFFGTHVPPLQ